MSVDPLAGWPGGRGPSAAAPSSTTATGPRRALRTIDQHVDDYITRTRLGKLRENLAQTSRSFPDLDSTVPIAKFGSVRADGIYSQLVGLPKDVLALREKRRSKAMAVDILDAEHSA